ncbi:unnamed protein product [Closterium sp. Naga37s-1]|nr:unnamed protein product [Closterium sp. Naga37s-1]
MPLLKKLRLLLQLRNPLAAPLLGFPNPPQLLRDRSASPLLEPSLSSPQQTPPSPPSSPPPRSPVSPAFSRMIFSWPAPCATTCVSPLCAPLEPSGPHPTTASCCPAWSKEERKEGREKAKEEEEKEGQQQTGEGQLREGRKGAGRMQAGKAKGWMQGIVGEGMMAWAGEGMMMI